jgi:uncharacterized protein (TIGR02444 family)
VRSAGGLWDFSLAIYKAPEVVLALLRLQDECNADVNLVLYILWRAALGQRVSDAGVMFMEQETALWRQHVVWPLRMTRRAMKQFAAGSLQSEALRRRVKDDELEAERLQQAFLEVHRAEIAETPSAPLATAIEAGLGAYATRLETGFAKADVAILTEAVAAWTRGPTA